MSKLTLLSASFLLLFTGHAFAQDVKDPPARRAADAGKVAAKPTAALRHLAAAEAAIRADTSLDEKKKKRALRSLNAVRRALGAKGKGGARRNRGKQVEGEGDAGGAKKRRRNRKKGASEGAGEKKKGAGRKKKNKKKKNGGDAGVTGKADPGKVR